VRPGGEWLNLALDEGADQLEARHLFLGCVLQPLYLLHQGIRDRHFLFS
jgi:hypothetical protein